MTIAVGLLGISIALLVIGFTAVLRSDYGSSQEGWGIAGIVLGAVGTLLMGILVAVAFFGPRHDRTVCERFADASGRETKFAHYSFWSWECLVETDEGWVSRDNIIKVDE